MRMLIHVKMPNEPFNSMVKDGSAGPKIQKALADAKPEAVYFTEYDGKRGAIMIVDVESPSRIPAMTEPFFLMFNAEISMHIVMSGEDLAKAGLAEIGQKYA